MHTYPGIFFHFQKRPLGFQKHNGHDKFYTVHEKQLQLKRKQRESL